MIRLAGLVNVKSLQEAPDVQSKDPELNIQPDAGNYTEEPSYIDSNAIIERIDSVIKEIESIDDDLMYELNNAEAATNSYEYRNAKAVISRYLSAALKNLNRVKRPINGL